MRSTTSGMLRGLADTPSGATQRRAGAIGSLLSVCPEGLGGVSAGGDSDGSGGDADPGALVPLVGTPVAVEPGTDGGASDGLVASVTSSSVAPVPGPPAQLTKHSRASHCGSTSRRWRARARAVGGSRPLPQPARGSSRGARRPALRNALRTMVCYRSPRTANGQVQRSILDTAFG